MYAAAGVLGPTTRELKSVMGAAFHPPTKHAAISPAVFKKKYVMGLPSAIEVTGTYLLYTIEYKTWIE